MELPGLLVAFAISIAGVLFIPTLLMCLICTLGYREPGSSRVPSWLRKHKQRRARRAANPTSPKLEFVALLSDPIDRRRLQLCNSGRETPVLAPNRLSPDTYPRQQVAQALQKLGTMRKLHLIAFGAGLLTLASLQPASAGGKSSVRAKVIRKVAKHKLAKRHQGPGTKSVTAKLVRLKNNEARVQRYLDRDAAVRKLTSGLARGQAAALGKHLLVWKRPKGLTGSELVVLKFYAKGLYQDANVPGGPTVKLEQLRPLVEQAAKAPTSVVNVSKTEVTPHPDAMKRLDEVLFGSSE
jgi:hypothetical protein